MSISSSRFAPTSNTFPSSPAPTTASSVNYSQYGGSAFSPPQGRLIPLQQPQAGAGPSSSSRMGNGNGNGHGIPRSSSGGLRPPGGGARPESRDVARVHFRALKEFLAAWLDKESPSSRASAREKLTRLTKLQFQELSTDVYDELVRRQAAEEGTAQGDMPFLPVRDDFHPKRNQARQKLATLPRNRFKDLASDVFYELRRRYPEFEEEEQDEEQMFDEPPPAPGPSTLRHPYMHSNNPSQASLRDEDRQRTGPTPPPMSRLNSATSSHRRQASRNMSAGSSVGSAPGPGPGYGGGMGHQSRPSISRDVSERSGLSLGDRLDRGQHQQQQPYNQGPKSSSNPHVTAATSEVVVPNKSRMREEDIEVPYARDSRIMDERDRDRSSSSRAPSRSSARDRPMSRSSLSLQEESTTPRDARRNPNVNVNGNANADATASPGTTDDREYYDRMSFSSNVTNKSKLAAGSAGTGWDEEREQKIRAEYEFRVAGLERRANQAEAERDEARRSELAGRERARELEEEVRGLKERSATHATSLRSLQHELDLSHDAAETARNHGEQSVREAEEEVVQWRERCDGLEDELRRLEEEKANWEDRPSGGSDQAVSELKKEIHSLVDELNSLSQRNDELMAEREQDAEGMNEMEAKVQEYKRKYDAVRIELRNLKATSVMFVSKPLTDDHLPASADGNIADIHVSAFQTAVDGLLASARSSAPSGVLPAMKAIVEAVTEIGEDVKAFELHPNLDVDASRLESLKHESTSRLNTLMQAARNHAMASGLSPLSLLDAAAGHLSSNVIEIIKLLKIKRSDKAEVNMRRSRSSLSIKDMVNRSTNANANATDVKAANGNWDKEYGRESPRSERPHDQSVPMSTRGPSEDRRMLSPTGGGSGTGTGRSTPIERQPQLSSARNVQPQPINGVNSNHSQAQPGAQSHSQNQNQNQLGTPTYSTFNGTGPPFRINSFQSVTSTSQRSDSFDLDRKPSVSSTSDRFGPGSGPGRPMVQPSRSGSMGPGSAPATGTHTPMEGSKPAYSHERSGSASVSASTSASVSSGGPNTVEYAQQASGSAPVVQYEEPQRDDGEDEKEWEDLKPYLNTQSSALVNSIQNLLAAIRTNSPPNALNDHLSEVIAISSSIVAVSSNALPAALRPEGDALLDDLVKDTDRLGEAQGSGVNVGDKGVRQQIASASFGVAKSLKALMKLGTE